MVRIETSTPADTMSSPCSAPTSYSLSASQQLPSPASMRLLQAGSASGRHPCRAWSPSCSDISTSVLISERVNTPVKDCKSISSRSFVVDLARAGCHATAAGHWEREADGRYPSTVSHIYPFRTTDTPTKMPPRTQASQLLKLSSNIS